MDTYQLIQDRVSIRKFNEKQISDEDTNKILQAAIHAPTAGNMVPYTILKIKNKETLEKLSESCDHQSFIKSADLALIFLVDLNKWHRYLENNNVKAYAQKTNRSYDGPTIADAILGINDALIASESAVIAAESLNIGSCYIGDIMENFEYHKELFDLPDYVFPAAMLVLGHYDSRPKPRYRFDQEYIVFDEKYRQLSDDDLEDMYKEKTKLYNSQDPNIENFAQQFYNRKMGAEFFVEMNRSLDVILEMFKKK